MSKMREMHQAKPSYAAQSVSKWWIVRYALRVRCFKLYTSVLVTVVLPTVFFSAQNTACSKYQDLSFNSQRLLTPLTRWSSCRPRLI